MVLLTSSQVQVFLSSAIVCTFTLLLFFTGYTIQQRSVDSLHVALRPRAPSPRHQSPVEDSLHTPTDPTSKYNRPFRRIRDRLKWQNQLVAADKPFDWSQLAFAQVVRDHSEICNALIIFSDLHRMKSAAPRLLLFPQHWIEEKDGEILDPFMETSRRLLKKASRRYRVTLVPVRPDVAGKSKDDPEAYSTAILATLDHYKRVMTFPPPGLVLDTTPLDSILAFADTQSIAAYPTLNDTESSTMLVVPSSSSKEALSRTTLSLSEADALLPDVQDHSLFTTSKALRTADPKTFNATDFITATAYVHFTDPDLPGPEYDIPYSNIVKMRPEGDDQAFLWEKMYSTYKDRRYGVCGLDLEVWPPLPKVEPVVEKHKGGGKERTDL